MADDEGSAGRSAAWGVMAAVFGGFAVAAWQEAAVPGSKFPILPAWGLGLVAMIGLYMCFATIWHWWPAQRARSTTSIGPQALESTKQTGAVGTANGPGITPSAREQKAITRARIKGRYAFAAAAVAIVLTAFFTHGFGMIAAKDHSPQRQYVYTVDPTKWAPGPVPGLSLARGDVVSITTISGHWICATVAGWSGIQGNANYTATNGSWAVPSAPFCSLIGKVGDGPWQGLGNHPQFTADRSGSLALTVNELMPENCPQPPQNTSCYTDNEGTIKILITVD